MKMITVFLTLAATMLLSFSAFAQTAPIDGFEWIPSVLGMLKAIPAVGKYLVYVFEFAAVASASLTALAVFLKSVLAIPQLAAKWAGATELAEKIKSFEEKVLPWIQYFSMFNVQKKK